MSFTKLQISTKQKEVDSGRALRFVLMERTVNLTEDNIPGTVGTTVGRFLQVINYSSAYQPGSALRYILLVEVSLIGNMFCQNKKVSIT